jgi:hypothetical protein
MFKNWKTSLAGILIGISQVGGVMGLPPKIVNLTTDICVVGGLITAKDHDVTGDGSGK